MGIQIRLLRDHLDNLPGARPELSLRQLERETRILDAGQSLMARFGRRDLTMGNFANALQMSRATLGWHFPDLDSLLAEILRRHLQAIATALGEIPFDAPNRQAAMRAVYVTYTRTGFGASTDAHLLLLRDRHALPPDLADSIEHIRLSIGQILAGPHAVAALALLDLPDLAPARIEAMLAALTPAQTRPPQPQPSQPQPHQPKSHTAPAPRAAAPWRQPAIPLTKIPIQPRAGPL